MDPLCKSVLEALLYFVLAEDLMSDEIGTWETVEMDMAFDCKWVSSKGSGCGCGCPVEGFKDAVALWLEYNLEK